MIPRQLDSFFLVNSPPSTPQLLSAEFCIVHSAHSETMNPTTPPPPRPPTSPPGASKQPPRALLAPPGPEALALAVARRAATDAAIEAAVAIYNAGGDPVGEREDEIMVENMGRSEEDIRELIETDEILMGLRMRGLVRR